MELASLRVAVAVTAWLGPAATKHPSIARNKASAEARAAAMEFWKDIRSRYQFCSLPSCLASGDGNTNGLRSAKCDIRAAHLYWPAALPLSFDAASNSKVPNRPESGEGREDRPV